MSAWRRFPISWSDLGLSDRLIVIEAGETGGTLAAGREALSMGIPTWVLRYEVPPDAATGNSLLIESGGRRVPVSANGGLDIPPDLFAIDPWIVTEVSDADSGDAVASSGDPPETTS